MAKIEKALKQMGSMSHHYLRTNNQNDILIANVGYTALTARRLVQLSANHNLIVANNRSPHVAGLPINQSNLVAGAEIFVAVNGFALGESYSTLEARLPIRAAPSGYITNGNWIGSGTEATIQAATAGLSGQITDNDANSETISVVSASASDVSYIVIFGYDASSAAQYEVIKMSGTTTKTGSKTFLNVYGAIIMNQNDIVRGTSTAAVGNVTITNSTSGTTLITISAASKSAGITEVTTSEAGDRKVRCTISALTGAPVAFIVGHDYKEDVVVEKVSWAASSDILQKQTTNRFSRVEYMVTGQFATRTLALAQCRPEVISYGLVNNLGDLTRTASTQTAGTIGVASDNTADVTQIVTIYGLESTTIRSDSVTLTGTTVAAAVSDYDTVLGAVLDGATAGVVTVYKSDGSSPFIAWDGSAYLSAGMLSLQGGNVSYSSLGYDGRISTLKLTCSNGSAADKIVIVGLDADGSAQSELVTLSGGTITSSNEWLRIDHIAALLGEATEYFTIEGVSLPAEQEVLGYSLEPSDAQGTEVEVFLE